MLFSLNFSLSLGNINHVKLCHFNFILRHLKKQVLLCRCKAGFQSATEKQYKSCYVKSFCHILVGYMKNKSYQVMCILSSVQLSEKSCPLSPPSPKNDLPFFPFSLNTLNMTSSHSDFSLNCINSHTDDHDHVRVRPLL